MTKDKNRILVTGGTGYIGSHTAVELIQSGYQVVLVDDLSNSLVSTLDGLEKIVGYRPPFECFNLCDMPQLEKLFRSYPDLVGIIHFAAYKSVAESIQKPLKYYRNNLVSLINLLEAQITFGVKPIVFSSSCTVYGQPKKLPVTEDSPIQKALAPYGNTKQIGEEILEDALKAHSGLQAICLRYFNPVGAHESGLIGELPLGVPENLVPYITQTAAGIRPELKVYGNDYDTPDGSCVRDFIHVVDLAKAHVVALQRMFQGKSKSNYEVFNLGTGNGFTVLEAIRSFERVSGQKLNFTVVGRRSGDIEKIWSDNTLANRELGWKAEKTLDEMMQSAWNWEQHYRRRTP